MKMNLDTSKDFLELEKIMLEKMYAISERSLYQFYKSFWGTHDASQHHTGWVQECICEHIQAAMERKIRRLVINVPPRCFDENEYVLQANGTRKQGKYLQIGDVVTSFNTKTGAIEPKAIVDVIDSGTKQCLTLTLSNNEQLTVSVEHKIWAQQGQYIQAQDLKIGDVVWTTSNQHVHTHTMSDDDCFLLGVWLAEGTKSLRTQYAYTNHSPEIADEVARIARSRGWEYRGEKRSYYHRWLGIESIKPWMIKYFGDQPNRNCYDIRVPTCVFNASRQNILGFLGAFIACDGWIDTQCGKISTELANKGLRDDIAHLFRLLGYTVSIKTRLPRKTNKTTLSATHYGLCISNKHDIDRLKQELFVYHKQTKLVSIDKNHSTSQDMPAEWINCTRNKWVSFNALAGRHYSLKQRDLCTPYKELHANNHRWLKITAITDAGIRKCMDITVDDNHNFYAGSGNVLIANSGKTTILVSGVVWNWLRRPEEQYWFLSHSSRLFIQNILLCRRIMAHPKFSTRWMNVASPDYKFSFADDQNTKTKIENNQKGYILGGSPRSTSLGMGYTVAAFDDIMDSEESARPGTVEKINSFYTGTFMNRSNDVNNDVTIINMQRLRQGDLTDYVNENYGEEGWFNLVLPARYDVTRVFLSPIGYNDKRTRPGQLLDPIRLPDSFLQMQEKDRIIYNTRYQQDPSSGRVGTYIKKEWLHRVAELPTYFEKVVTVWDLSFDDKVGASYTVGLTGGIRKDKITLFDMFRNQVDIVRQVAAIKAMRDKLPQSEICLENKANGSAAKTLLRDQVPNIRHLDPAVYGGSKEARVMSILPYLHEHGLSVYDPSLLTAYSSTKHIPDETYDPGAIEDELVAFPLGRTSDIVDCVAYLTAILTHETSGSDIVITRGTKIKLFGEDFEVNGLPAERSHDPYDLFGEGLPTLNSIGEISW
jgi:hypothetical protein